MQNLIMPPPPGMIVDHINCDGLDNRKANLRICTQGDNMHNTRKYTKPTSSQYKGVYWKKADRRWAAQIGLGGARIALGLFRSEEAAAAAYNEAATEHYGEYARLNEIPGDHHA
jgi:hypothetical protein